ncbi:Spore germination protein A1 [compost metagenome]
MDTQTNMLQNERLTGRLEIDEELLQSVFAGCSDIVFHSFQTANGTPALCVYCFGLCNVDRLERQVLAPLQGIGRDGSVIDGEQSSSFPEQAQLREDSSREHRGDQADSGSSQVPISSIRTVNTVSQAIEAIMDGKALIIVEGKASGTIYSLYKVATRSPEEPAAESTVRGARDGFTESLNMNLSLLRKRMKTPALKLQILRIGEYTKTKVVLAYMDGLIDPELVKEVQSRLDRLKIKDVLESQFIEEGIVDQRFSPFPQMIATERPDVIVSNLLEGRFALLVDGTPFSLVAPVTLFSMLQSPEDYYQNMYMSLFVRWLRYFFYVLSLLLPSAYVAITTFHQEMIPTVLLLSIARAREEIPFPALVEALIMEISFEALREAGVRLPKQVGSAVSIVGALIIGQAATSAGIVSAPMIIIVAITGIASFMIPRYAASLTTRLMRFPMMLLAGTLGLIGVMLGIILIVIHLSSLRSFGTPYLSPAAPTFSQRLKDVWWRPMSWSKNR